jgi:hypothetical protein
MRPRVAALAILVVACSSDDDNRQVTSGFASVSSTAPTTIATDATTGGSGSDSGATEPATSADTTGEPGPTYFARGTVIDFGTLNMPTIDDATVRVFGDPSSTTSTGAEGLFEIPVPAGAIAYVEIAKDGYWGAIVRADATTGDVELGEINVANDTFISTRVAAFDNFDLQRAAVIARATATDVTLSLLQAGAPATAMNEYFSIDAQVNFMLGDNVTRSAGFPAVVFFNLPDLAAGALSMTAQHATLGCAVAMPVPPTQARTITWIEITC